MKQTVLKFVGSLNIGMRLTSDGMAAPDPAFEILAGAYIPGFLMRGNVAYPAVTAIHRESVTRRASVTRSRVVIRDAWNGRVGADAYHLLYAMARAKWLEDGIYPAHAACIETRPGECVLLAGPSGAGKTTVMLEMLRRPGSRMLSGNKTLLDLRDGRLSAVGGTLTVTLASPDAARLPFKLENAVEYGGRTAGLLKPDRITRTEQVVTRIIFPKLRSGPGEVTAVSPLRALHMLHPVLLDAANADVVLAGGAGTYIDGCPTDARRELAPLLAGVLGSVRVTEVSGDAAFIAAEANS